MAPRIAENEPEVECDCLAGTVDTYRLKVYMHWRLPT